MANDSATAGAAQDVTARIEAALYPEEPRQEEPVATEDDEVLEGAEELPEDDDSDSEEDEGSEDLDDGADDEEVSLAAYLGIDEDRIIVNEDGTVSVKAIIDGEAKPVSLKELAASYQLQGHVNNKSMALENERKEFESVRTQVAQELQQRVEGAQALSQVLEQQLVGEYNKINWDRLRTENPTEWTALRQEFAERAQKVQQTQELLKQENERIRTEQQQAYQQQMTEHLKEQHHKMLEKNPEWTDVSKRQEAMSGMKNFLTSTYGYSDADFDNVTDHRLIELVKDAKAYREGKKAAETKKVKQVPKFQKPGAARTNAAQLAKARDIKAKKVAIKKSGGSVQSVANALIDRM